MRYDVYVVRRQRVNHLKSSDYISGFMLKNSFQTRCGCNLGGEATRILQQSTHLRLSLILRKCGAIPPLPPHAFIVCTGSTFTFMIRRRSVNNECLFLNH